MIDKHTFFYSRTSEPCRSAAALIQQRRLRDRFYFVDVDQYRRQLPNFISTVPLVYTQNSEVLTGDDLFLFVKHLHPPPPPPSHPTQQQQQQHGGRNQQQQQQRQQQEVELEGFELSGANASLSDAFSFIGDGGESVGMAGPKQGFESVPSSADSNNNKNNNQQQRSNGGGGRENVVPPPKLPSGSQFPKPVETRKITNDFSADLDRFKAMRDNEVGSHGPRVF
jgi:hypothetical protein